MKKIRVLGFLSLLLVVAMLLAACGETAVSTVSSYGKVLNKDYDPSADVTTTATSIPELSGYSLGNSNEEFAVFTKASETVNQKVLSLRTGKVILTLTTTEENRYTINLAGDVPAFTVLKRSGAELEDTRYILYDATGDALTSSEYSKGTPTMFADLVLYGDTLYEIEDNGKLNESATIPEYSKKTTPSAYSEKYFYYFGKYGIDIFNRNFEFVSRWTSPQFAKAVEGVSDEAMDFFVLNNGDVLFQYMILLDSHTEKYDIGYPNGNEISKYDLVTMILDAKSGKTTEIELNYLVNGLLSAFDAKEMDDKDNPMYADGFQNFALVYPIKDRCIDTSSDIVLLNNSGKITASLKLADHQNAGLLSKIAKDKYVVSTLYGFAIVDIKGKVLQSFNNTSMEFVGSYVVGDKAVYDLDMHIAYNLLENDAKVIGTMDDTVFISKTVSATSYDIISLRNGERQTICTIDRASSYATEFALMESAGCYELYQQDAGEYTYYNAEGDVLLRTPTGYDVVEYSYTYGVAVLRNADGEYYVFAE